MKVPDFLCEQKSLNEIHSHFSALIGNEDFQGEIWNKSSPMVRDAICGLNDYVHEIEAYQRSYQSQKDIAFICCEFFESPSIKIDETMKEAFSIEQEFGDITLHYDQIGKSWLEVLIDKDKSAKAQDIRPLEKITSGLNINFYSISKDAILKKVTSFAQEIDLNLERDDLHLGQLKIARLEENDSHENILKKLAKCDHISTVHLKKANKTILSKKFSSEQFRRFSFR